MEIEREVSRAEGSFQPDSANRVTGREPPMVPGIDERDLGLHPLSSSRWRVLDNRLPQSDARRLLGFIEKKDDRFEVTQLDHGFAWFSFATLGEAIAQFTRERPIEVAGDEHVLAWMRPETGEYPPARSDLDS